MISNDGVLVLCEIFGNPTDIDACWGPRLIRKEEFSAAQHAEKSIDSSSGDGPLVCSNHIHQRDSIDDI